MAKYGINKATLVGNLGKDPELRYLDSGTAVATFTLATTERFRSRDGQTTEKTEWHNVVMWRQMAETFSKYLRKGSTVYLEGRIITRSWDQDGVTRYRTEIEAKEMVMLDGRQDSQGYNPAAGNPAAQSSAPSTGQKPKTASPQKTANTGNMPPANADDPDDLPF